MTYAELWSKFYKYDSLDVEQIFNHLKSVTHYKEDPSNVELLQSMPSLFEDNYWGTPGTGDCDCFTITSCAVLLVNGYKTGFSLYGNGKQPTHIASDVHLKKGGRLYSMPFDLCAPRIDMVKPYIWVQEYKLSL